MRQLDEQSLSECSQFFIKSPLDDEHEKQITLTDYFHASTSISNTAKPWIVLLQPNQLKMYWS